MAGGANVSGYNLRHICITRQVCETLLEMLKEAAKIGKGCASLDASGGVTHEIARAIVKTGVDFVSSGALTHLVKVVDLTMEFA